MKVAILGAGGFIGANTVKLLSTIPSYQITALDITDEKLSALNCRDFTYVKCDIRSDHKLLEQTVESADVVLDLIAHANPSLYIAKPLDVVQLNLFENLKIVELCLAHGKRLIQFSSSEVYGMTGGSDKPFKEDETKLTLGPVARHRWIYSCAKQLLERMVHAYGLSEGLRYTIVRPFNFFGPEIDYLVTDERDGNPRVFSHFMSALLFNRPMYLVDGGRSLRTFTYIGDAVEAFRLILDNEEACAQQILNVGNPANEISIRDLAYMMVEIYCEYTGRDLDVPIIEISAEAFYGPGYEDCDRRLPDIAKLADLGWQPRYDLTDTVRHTMRYYIERYLPEEGS